MLLKGLSNLKTFGLRWRAFPEIISMRMVSRALFWRKKLIFLKYELKEWNRDVRPLGR